MSFASFFYKLADILIRLRGLVVALVLLLTVFFAWQMQGLRFDNSNEIWFTESDPALKRLNEFHRIFGNDDFVYLLFDGEGLFKSGTIALYESLVKDFRAQVPYLRSVTWLGNAEYISADADGITVSDFIDADGPPVPEADLRQRAMREKLYLNNLISPDGKSAGMLLELSAYPKGVTDPRSEVAGKIRQVLAMPAYASLDIHVVGQPILHTDYNEISFKESAMFFGLCLLLQMAVLYRVGKSVRDAVVPMLVIVLSVIWTLGMIRTLGYTLNLFIILIPVLLACVCIGDSVHIIDFFRQHRREGLEPGKALRQALADSGAPCFHTTLTTVAGFLSFFAADLRPFQEMGVYAALGVTSAYVLSVLVVLVAYSMFQPKTTVAAGPPGRSGRSPGQGRTEDFFDRVLHWVWKIDITYPGRIIAAAFLLTVVCLYGYSLIHVETNTARMLSPDLPLRQSYDYADQRMGGAMSVEIMLDTGKDDGIKEPDFLHAMEKLQQSLDGEALVSKTISLLDILKKINESMHGGDAAFYTLPDKRESAAQYILLYEMSNGKELDKMISFDGRIARLTAKTQTLDTRQVRELTEKIAAYSRDIFGPEVTVSVTGNLDWTRSMNDLLAKGQGRSFLAALVSVTLLMVLALGSLRLGILSMIPNVLPVLATLGLMGLAGIYMDMPLMSFSAIMIGVIVDDTTHFLYHFKEELDRSASYPQALRDTLATTGRPLLFTTLTLFCGFGVLMFSDVMGVVKFGGLGCFAFALALAADFFVMPAVLLVLKPLKVKEKAGDGAALPSTAGGGSDE